MPKQIKNMEEFSAELQIFNGKSFMIESLLINKKFIYQLTAQILQIEPKILLLERFNKADKHIAFGIECMEGLRFPTIVKKTDSATGEIKKVLELVKDEPDNGALFKLEEEGDWGCLTSVSEPGLYLCVNGANIELSTVPQRQFKIANKCPKPLKPTIKTQSYSCKNIPRSHKGEAIQYKVEMCCIRDENEHIQKKNAENENSAIVKKRHFALEEEQLVQSCKIGRWMKEDGSGRCLKPSQYLCVAGDVIEPSTNPQHKHYQCQLKSSESAFIHQKITFSESSETPADARPKLLPVRVLQTFYSFLLPPVRTIKRLAMHFIQLNVNRLGKAFIYFRHGCLSLMWKLKLTAPPTPAALESSKMEKGRQVLSSDPIPTDTI